MDQYYNQIKKFNSTHKRMPSWREIMTITGLKSLNAVAKLIKKMVSLDMVIKDSHGKIIQASKKINEAFSLIFLR